MDWRPFHHDINHLDVNIIDDARSWEIQVFGDARLSRHGSRLAGNEMKAMRARARCAAAVTEEAGLGLSDFSVLDVLLDKGPSHVDAIGPIVDLTAG